MAVLASLTRSCLLHGRFRLGVLLLACLLPGLSTTALAHDQNVASIRIIQQSPDTWIFDLRTPLGRLDQSMRRFHADADSPIPASSDRDSNHYKALVVDYVKSVFSLEFAGDIDQNATPALGRGRIKLADHLSILIFEIRHMPDEPGAMSLTLPYMAENTGQHTILWLIDGKRSERHVLSEKNRFSLPDTGFFAESDPQGAPQ